MLKEIEIKLLPAEAQDEALIRKKAARKLKVSPEQIDDLRLLRRSIDARGYQPVFRLRLAVYFNETYQADPSLVEQFRSVAEAPRVIIVGAGPAGYFAALELIELGLKPIVFDRERMSGPGAEICAPSNSLARSTPIPTIVLERVEQALIPTESYIPDRTSVAIFRKFCNCL
jgi:hypothetical protein